MMINKWGEQDKSPFFTEDFQIMYVDTPRFRRWNIIPLLLIRVDLLTSKE